MKQQRVQPGQALEFVLLDGPPAPPVLVAFRRNAGWKAGGGAVDARPFDARGRVQWTSVRLGMRTIAIARLELAPPRFCYVSDVIVLDAHRGKGVGEWFMARIGEHCAAHGIPRLLLNATAGARGFYEKLRFTADPLVDGVLCKELLAPHRVTAAAPSCGRPAWRA